MPSIATLRGNTELPTPDDVDRPRRDAAAQPAQEGEETPPRPTTVLRPPSFSPLALVRAAAHLVHYRDLIYTLSEHRVSVRYKQSVLGPGWAILQPLSLMLIYTVIFSRVAHVPSEGVPYALFAYCALLPWTYFSTGASTATNSLVTHFHLVTKVYFPREILPLTYVIVALLDFLVASAVLFALMLYYNVSLTARAVYAIPTIAVLTVFTLAMSLLLSAIQVRHRDISVAMPLVLQVWMFATPVVYPLSVVPDRWQSIYSLNPMVGIVESFRRVILMGTAPDVPSLATAAVVSVTLLLVTFAYFKNVEATVADII